MDESNDEIFEWCDVPDELLTPVAFMFDVEIARAARNAKEMPDFAHSYIAKWDVLRAAADHLGILGLEHGGEEWCNGRNYEYLCKTWTWGDDEFMGDQFSVSDGLMVCDFHKDVLPELIEQLQRIQKHFEAKEGKGD